MRSLTAVICLLTLLSTLAAAAGAVSVDSLPPVVTQTVPASGDKAVDPGLAEIRITFSKDMLTEKMWSFVQLTKATFPDKAGDPHYLKDGRTIVLPVKLAPGRTYALWINKGNFNAFKDKGKRAAVPYLLVFETSQK